MGNSKEIKKGNSKSPVESKNASPKLADASPKATDEVLKDGLETILPPPRPVISQQISNTPDYFSGAHGNLSLEQNPFEHSFSTTNVTNGDKTPGGTKLPSISALTSPANNHLGHATNFWGGLRTGPLSPSMLSGPVKEDYFGDRHHGFPTPNESSLRSGLTPGGSGSMFPEPSPGSSALYAALGSGGATPATLDFHRTAMAAASLNKNYQQNITSQPQDLSTSIEAKPIMAGQFDQHDANDAANGLFLLAQARNGPSQTNHYTTAHQHPVHAHPQPNPQIGGSTAPSPNLAHQKNASMSTASGRAVSEMSGFSEEAEPSTKPNTRGKGKKGAAQTNGRRKAEDGPSKTQASKKAKANSGNAVSLHEPEPEPPSEEEPDMSKDEYNANGKKMTDEEKRRNFLERNRVAALKCRQRKKQWLANLQHKVEAFSVENDALATQCAALREEVVNLKTLLLAHKECPVTHAQGLAGLGMDQIINGGGGPFAPHMAGMNPYNMAQQQQQQMIVERRFS